MKTCNKASGSVLHWTRQLNKEKEKNSLNTVSNEIQKTRNCSLRKLLTILERMLPSIMANTTFLGINLLE